MPGQGPAPKDPAKRRRRNVDTIARTEVAADGRRRGPGLPSDVVWHPRTVAWWSSWRKSAQAKTFLPTDWDFLLDTAAMHSAMWTEGDWKLAPEIRLRAAKMGATIEDRARLRLDVEVPGGPVKPKPAPAGVTDIAARRARLSG
jgi:hypothetical protein